MISSVIPWLKKSVSSIIHPSALSHGSWLLPSLVHRLAAALLLTSTVLYLLFQKKLLPKPLAFVVSKIFFYPTFPITALMRLGNFWTLVDDTLILGCAPFSICGHPKMLHEIGVRGVINMCAEYSGPKSDYLKLGMTQLYLPTVDHTEPSLEQYEAAVNFIKTYKDKDEKVYVHCKAGHGRGASIAFAWMLHENPETSPVELNALLRSTRNVRKTLYKQKNVLSYISKLNTAKPFEPAVLIRRASLKGGSAAFLPFDTKHAKEK